MSKIKNLLMRGKKLMISKNMVEFDANGIAEVTPEQAEILLTLKNYSAEDGISDPEDKVPDSLDKSSSEPETSQSEDESTAGEDENVPEEKVADGIMLTAEDLDSKTVPVLRKIAKDNGIDLNGASKKDEIIPIILGAIG